MKEFMSILISFVFMGIADNIDAAFNNSISLDTIVVCGSLLSISLILRSITDVGIFTYRTVRKREWSYLWINIIVGLLVGIIVFLSKDILITIFHLTDFQKEMLSSLLDLYIVYLVLDRVANAIFEMVRLKGELKLYRKSLIIFYILLIGLDAIAYFATKNLILLFVATMVSWFVSIIYMLSHLKLKFEWPDKETLKTVTKYGIPTSLERLLSRVFLLLYGILASHLGTENYSIHTICYSVCVSLEIITNAYQATLMIKVPEGKTYEEQYDNCMKMKKKCFSLILVLNIVFSIVYLLISHGSLPLYQCFPYIIFYSFTVFGLYPYESYKTLCITQGKPFILLFGSTFGVIIRFLICLLFIKTPFALFIFGIVNFIDFYFRSVIFKIGLSRSFNKPNKQIKKRQNEMMNA